MSVDVTEPPSKLRSSGAASRRLGAVACLLLLAVVGPWWDERSIGSVDGAWMMALTDAAVHGAVVGRDLYATYGWGFQQIGLLARTIHQRDSTVESILLLHCLLWLIGAGFLVCAVVLGGPRHPAGMLIVVGAAGIVAICSRTQATWIRPAALILIAALTARALDESRRGHQPIRFALVAALAALLQLLAYDTGIFAVAVVVSAAALSPLFDRGLPRSQRLSRALLGGSSAAIGAAAVTSTLWWILTPQGGSMVDGPRVVGELIHGYRATMALPWQLGSSFALGMALFLAGGAGLAWRASRPGEARCWLPLAVAALLSLPAAIVRSDAEHIWLAVLPFVVLVASVGADRASPPARRLAAALLASLLVVLHLGRGVPGTLLSLNPAAIVGRWNELCALDLSRRLAVPAALARGEPSAPLFVFPHHHQYALFGGRRLSLTFVQAYQATTARLDVLAAARLSSRVGTPPLEALVEEDGSLDRVQAMSRNPALFEALWRNYRLVAAEGNVQPSGGWLLLRRVDTPRELASRPVFRRDGQSETGARVTLSAPASCALLRVAFDLEYPWAASFGRKGAWYVEVADGSLRVVRTRIVALDARHFETLIDLLPTSEAGAIFRGGARRRTFDSLTLEPADVSLLAVQPRFVEVSAIDCLDP